MQINLQSKSVLFRDMVEHVDKILARLTDRTRSDAMCQLKDLENSFDKFSSTDIVRSLIDDELERR
jgi:hypothetical protein|tara:strand:- start:213 stop:410 length:198 start_codon:yes stop_codon:yes gene_type:complete